MKKAVLLLLAISIIFTFCSCSSNINTEQNTQITEKTEKKEANTTIEMTEKSTESIFVRVGEKKFTAKLYNNKTAQTFADMLPLTLDMNELHGNEKYHNLSSSLPTNSSGVGKINNGDIMLYGDNCLVLFYDSFSTQYSYTKIGYIENTEELADAVGSGNVTVSFEK